MKKILLFAIVLVLYSFNYPTRGYSPTVEDRLICMYTYMKHDIKEGKVDPTVGKTYLHNLTKCLVEIKSTPFVANK